MAGAARPAGSAQGLSADCHITLVTDGRPDLTDSQSCLRQQWTRDRRRWWCCHR
jgi:hypothetical protein